MQSFPIYLTRDHIGILAAFTATEQTHSSNNYTENDLQTQITILSAKIRLSNVKKEVICKTKPLYRITI